MPVMIANACQAPSPLHDGPAPAAIEVHGKYFALQGSHEYPARGFIDGDADRLAKIGR
jgi:hypothetical protein